MDQTLDSLLKKLAISVARNEFHQNIRLIAGKSITSSDGYLGIAPKPSVSARQRLQDYMFDCIKVCIPAKYLIYGKENMSYKDFPDFSTIPIHL